MLLVVEESSFAVMYMHENNGAFVVQDTSVGYLNLSCAVLSLDSSVFIFWNRLYTILHMYSAWFSRKVVVMHALEESVAASFVPQLLPACLLLRAAACSSHDHLLEPR